jgi:hypothetical protein
MNDHRNLTEVRHAKSYERCVLCDDLGRFTAAKYQVSGEAHCEEHSAVMLSIALSRVLARWASRELVPA